MSATRPRHGRLGVAILGAGYVGDDLVRRLAQRPESMELLLAADTDARAVGLRRARGLGIPVSSRGVAAILGDPAIELVFDATTASAHVEHAPLLRRAGKLVIDLTPAALGPCVVPLVNLTRHLGADDVSLASAAAQATVPVVRELSRLAPLVYGEVVSVLPSASVGPGSRRDVDEATDATARALRELGGVRHAKSITILSPAEPAPPMRCTLRAIPERELDEREVEESVLEAVRSLRDRFAGYRLASGPRFETRDTPWGRRVTITLRVEVAGDGDPDGGSAGNLDLVSVCARDLGEELAGRRVPAEIAAVRS
jgi:acetaldehyde dehydrogenase